MAIYHFRAKAGKSVISHFYYINRLGKYKNKKDLEATSSFNVPFGFKDIQDFWEQALLNERANANIYREYEITLPKELTVEKNKEILESFLKKQFGDKYVYNYAIHNPSGEQPHAHVMFCERELDGIKRTRENFFKRYNPQNPENGGAKKNRQLQKKEFLYDKRKDWEMHLNKFLESYGIEKVSCETLKKQRDEAIKDGNLLKAELLDRKPIMNFLNSKLKNDELDDEEKEEYDYRKFEKNMKEDIKEKIKFEKFHKDYKREKEERKEKTFKEILDEKEKLESEIFKLQKKLDPKRLRENVYRVLSKGRISKLKNEKRSLFKQIKNTKDKSEKQKLKHLVKQIDKQIENIKLEFSDEKVLEKELEMRTKYMKALNFLNVKLQVMDKIFMDKLKDLDKSDYENLKYYEAYIQRKDLREERENLKNDIRRNKAKIKKDVAIGRYKSAYNIKKFNHELRRNVRTCDSILKKIARDQKLNERNIQYGEFKLDEYKYATFEAYLESLDYER